MKKIKMYNKNDSHKKIAKRNAKRKVYTTKLNYIEKTRGKIYSPPKNNEVE